MPSAPRVLMSAFSATIVARALAAEMHLAEMSEFASQEVHSSGLVYEVDAADGMDSFDALDWAADSAAFEDSKSLHLIQKRAAILRRNAARAGRSDMASVEACESTTTCSTTTSAPFETEDMRSARDCHVAEWSDWSPCMRQSTNAYQPTIKTRIRKVIVAEAEGGHPCPALSERRMCGGWWYLPDDYDVE
mmetsp:Transcript_50926/g.94299  ORF Transcript_50926/g.94299 Transcript_50926/m.94299 type:complete len:191 (+) Transcript_50926:65-637(+)